MKSCKTYPKSLSELIERPKLPLTHASNEEGSSCERLVFEEQQQSPSYGRHRGPHYCRTRSGARRHLETNLLRLYNRDQISPDNDIKKHSALVFPSGMNAIGAVLTSLVRHHAQARSKAPTQDQPLLIFHGDELYCDVYRTIRYTTESYPHGNVISKAVDVCNSRELINLFTTHSEDIGIFHWESASNPSSQMFDPALLPQLRMLAPHCVFVCDNTWLSGACFNPLDYGVDVVIESMTKHLSAGSCIGGMVIGKGDIMKPVEEYVRVMGIFVGADRCEEFSKGLKDVHTRVKSTSTAALAVASFLQEDQRVIDVAYPLLSSHPSYAVASEYLAFGPGCVWCQLPVSQNKLFKAVSALDTLIEYKTSFGGPTSRIDPWPRSEQMRDNLSGKVLPTVWVRLYMGYNEPADITIAKVTTLLDGLCGKMDKKLQI